MLSYKRFKQLRARRIEINHSLCRLKSLIKSKQRINNCAWKHVNYESTQINLKREINIINDALRLHKILYKQHLANQEYMRNMI